MPCCCCHLLSPSAAPHSFPLYFFYPPAPGLPPPVFPWQRPLWPVRVEAEWFVGGLLLVWRACRTRRGLIPGLPAGSCACEYLSRDHRAGMLQTPPSPSPLPSSLPSVPLLTSPFISPPSPPHQIPILHPVPCNQICHIPVTGDFAGAPIFLGTQLSAEAPADLIPRHCFCKLPCLEVIPGWENGGGGG